MSGPQTSLAKYFLYTGNTTYGIQNLEYDGYTGNWFAAVYQGKKPFFSNFPLYVIDGSELPVPAPLLGQPDYEIGLTLSLHPSGIFHIPSRLWGYDFPYGQTGLCSLDNGLFYISHNAQTGRGQCSTVRLYRWTGSRSSPFEPVG